MECILYTRVFACINEICAVMRLLQRKQYLYIRIDNTNAYIQDHPISDQNFKASENRKITSLTIVLYLEVVYTRAHILRSPV